ncbi:hypothetical protein [Adlercreutzia sp. ZJ473]|uniref:hypothetical protein n=1 Tax=Adlercreutzia sp. ZJ473 TaxID=2722822 RepID=UPI001C1316D3|nr:hypothetical protein [Adlercreutzia sp. ZJ473]
MPDVQYEQYDQYDATVANLERMRRRARPAEQRTRHERAFVVEALFLLVFMMSSLAVLTGLMVSSYERGAAADDLSYAAVLASNDAEAFAADPTGPSRGAAGTGVAEGFQLTRDVEQHAQEAGVLYEAHITVSCDGHAIYELDTARYVSNEAAAARASGATQAVSFSSFSVADEFSTLTSTAALTSTTNAAGDARSADEAASPVGEAAPAASASNNTREEVTL